MLSERHDARILGTKTSDFWKALAVLHTTSDEILVTEIQNRILNIVREFLAVTF
jgi:hypothetical protein